MTTNALQQKSMDDYLQEAAFHYMQRRQAEPQSNADLFTRAVEFLERTTGRAKALCENAVARAYGQLRGDGEPRYLDVDLSNANTIVIADPTTDMRYVIPVRQVLEHFVDKRQPAADQ